MKRDSQPLSWSLYMRLIQTLIALAIVGLTGGVVFHFVRSNEVERKVDQANERIDQQENELRRVESETGQRLATHDERLEAVEAKSKENEARVTTLRTRLATLRETLTALETAGEKDRARIDGLREEIGTVTKRIDTLEVEKTSMFEEVMRLRKDMRSRDQRDAALLERLRLIEEKVGIESPRP